LHKRAKKGMNEVESGKKKEKPGMRLVRNDVKLGRN